jgi:hypothetical protein
MLGSKFELSARLTIRAVAKVADAYKRGKSRQCLLNPPMWWSTINVS